MCCDVESMRLEEKQPQRNKSPQDTGRGTGGTSCEVGGRVQLSFLPVTVACPLALWASASSSVTWGSAVTVSHLIGQTAHCCCGAPE